MAARPRSGWTARTTAAEVLRVGRRCRGRRGGGRPGARGPGRAAPRRGARQAGRRRASRSNRPGRGAASRTRSCSWWERTAHDDRPVEHQSITRRPPRRPRRPHRPRSHRTAGGGGGARGLRRAAGRFGRRLPGVADAAAAGGADASDPPAPGAAGAGLPGAAAVHPVGGVRVRHGLRRQPVRRVRRPRDGVGAELRGVRAVRGVELPAADDRGAVLRRHDRERGVVVEPEVPARHADPPPPADAAEGGGVRAAVPVRDHAAARGVAAGRR